jgi:hypothetical protein
VHVLQLDWLAYASPPNHPLTSKTQAPTLLTLPCVVTLFPLHAQHRFALSTLNPLLGQVSELAEGSRGALRTTFAPGGWV